MIHAFAVVGSCNADRRNRELISAMGYPQPSKPVLSIGGIILVTTYLPHHENRPKNYFGKSFQNLL